MSFQTMDHIYETLSESAVELGLDPTKYENAELLLKAIDEREEEINERLDHDSDWAYDCWSDNQLTSTQ